jgi:hypothetical protein
MNEPKAIWNVAHHADDLIGSYSKTEGDFILLQLMPMQV